VRPGDYPPGTIWPLALDTTSPILMCEVYDGRTVVLTEGNWNTHILVRHPEMEDKLQLVEWCLIHPVHVNHDVRNTARECYYQAYTSSRGRPLWMKILVHFDDSVQALRGVDGYVVTALVCNRIKIKEVRKWP
jgi:hypothetical protein